MTDTSSLESFQSLLCVGSIRHIQVGENRFPVALSRSEGGFTWTLSIGCLVSQTFLKPIETVHVNPPSVGELSRTNVFTLASAVQL